MGRFEPYAVWTIFWRTLGKHYFDPDRRVSRHEFWHFVLGCLIACVAVAVADVFAKTNLPSLIAGLALLLPLAGMGSGRLRDTEHDGRLVWLLIVPLAIMHFFWLVFLFAPFSPLNLIWLSTGLATLIQWIALLALVGLAYFWMQSGTTGPNRYGSAPSDGPEPEPVNA